MKNKKKVIIISSIIFILLMAIGVIVYKVIDSKEYEGRSVIVVEPGCTYIIAATGEELKEGSKIPTPANGDIYKTKDYEYKYIADFNDKGNILLDLRYAQFYYDEITVEHGYDKKYETECPLIGLSGWNHSTINKEKEVYEDIAGSIVGEPIIQVSFEDCAKMKKSPNLPKSTVIMYRTYEGCKSLTSSVKIPKGVKFLYGTYNDCTNLTKVPEIPDGVMIMTGTFSGCEKIKEMPKIPDSVICMNRTFSNCTALKKVKKLPSGVVNISSLFEGCTSLQEAPAIPDGVVNMSCTFRNCTNLKKVKRVPASVKTIEMTFSGCTSLTGNIAIEVPNIIAAHRCFDGVHFEEQGLTLSGNPEFIEHLLTTAHTC